MKQHTDLKNTAKTRMRESIHVGSSIQSSTKV